MLGSAFLVYMIDIFNCSDWGMIVIVGGNMNYASQ